MAGKGDSYRPVNQKKWEENWERAFNANTRKRNTHQMQRAYLKGQRRPLPVTSVDIKSWIMEGNKHEQSGISEIGERRGSSRKD